MSDWRDRRSVLGAFREVPFFVATHDAALGRRVALHEFPQRDAPYSEDMGRKARVLSFEAFVLGSDYMAPRDRLVRAFEQAGPGLLRHPYLGDLVVSITSVRLREGTDEGGVARFSVECIEAGAALFPTNEASTAAKVGACAAAASDAASASVAQRYVVAGKPAYVADGAASVMTAALDAVHAAAARVSAVTASVAELQRMVDATRRDLVTLIYLPASAAQALVSAVRYLVRSVATTPSDMLSLARTMYDFGGALLPVLPTTPSRAAQALNQGELTRLVRVAALAEGAAAASRVGWVSYEEAVAVRDELTDAMDAVMLEPGIADEVFDALRALRAAVVRDVAARGADLARLVGFTPRLTLPMLAIAQQVYADGSRVDEMLARNRTRHPLFVPGGRALEVLSDG